MGSVSDDASEVISDETEEGNARDKLSEMARVSGNRRRSDLPNYSKFR